MNAVYVEYKGYEENEWNTPLYNIIVLIIVSLLLIPLSLAKDIGKMKFFVYLELLHYFIQ